MEWKSVEDCKPEQWQRVWIYMPFFPEKWKFNCPEVMAVYYLDNEFLGIGKENQIYVKAWIPWVEVYSSVAPKYIRPERLSEKTSKEDAIV